MPSQTIPIFYINLAAREDRRRYMEDQFARLGLSAERVEATTVADLSDADYNRWRRLSGHVVSRPEAACSLSHQAIWRQIVERRLPAALILEDDAILSDRLPELLVNLGPHLPAGIDVLKLETFNKPVRLSPAQTQLSAFSISRLLGTHHGTCGYVISADMASHALHDPELHNHPIDIYLFGRLGTTICKKSIYQLIPALSIQLPTGTADAVARSDLRGLRGLHGDRGGKRSSLARLRRTDVEACAAFREQWHFRDAFRTKSYRTQYVPFADTANDSEPN
jgi:glycosyl transferase family 25